MRAVEKRLRERLKYAEQERDEQISKRIAYACWLARHAKFALRTCGEGKSINAEWACMEITKLLATHGDGWRL